MSDHPVLIPTSIGPIGGMVSVPDGGGKAAAVLVAGVGGRRFGVNRLWTAMAWDLADRGYVVLRLDYPGGQGDSSLATRDGTPKPFREVLAWFRQRTGELPLVLLGSCYGARLVASVGSVEENLLGIGLITPTFVRWKKAATMDEDESLASKVRRKARKKIGRVAPLALDQRVVDAVSKALQRTQVWAMVGEKDHRARTDLSRLQAVLRKEDFDGLEIDEIPGVILHTQPSVEGQETTRERVGAWASRLLDQEVVRN